jgi:hypothetical protein
VSVARVITLVAGIGALALLVAGTPGYGARPRSADPTCSRDYASKRPTAARRLRFGIDPEPAGSAGSVQGKVKPVNDAKALAALRSLRPAGKQLVLRVSRLFEGDGEAGIRRFHAIIARYTREGFDTELQVRYHPAAAQAGNIAAWERYVSHVVDAIGANRHVLAMTITNEINVTTSPNTSDGSFPHAADALVQGIIAAHREAQRRGFTQLRFGFTFAYLPLPADASMFVAIRRGGAHLRRALGFVGVDYYPELFPGRAATGVTSTVTMLAAVRRCFMRAAGLGGKVPIWITESGYDATPGVVSAAQQRSALFQLVSSVRGAAKTYGVTDFRWFNLRDNLASATGFAETTGLLADDYARKPAFAAFRGLIARYGAAAPVSSAGRSR